MIHGPYFRDPTTLQNDPRYRILTLTQKGIFAELCDSQWTGCGIPSDPEDLMDLLHISDRAEFDRHWSRLNVFFQPMPGKPGRLFWITMEEDRKRRDRKQRDRSLASKIAAKRRWELARQHAAIQTDTCERIASIDASALPKNALSLSLSLNTGDKPPYVPPKSDAKNEKAKFGEDGFVRLTAAEHEKLSEKLKDRLDEMINRLNGYIGQIGEKKARAKYKSHYHVILNWSNDGGSRNGAYRNARNGEIYTRTLAAGQRNIPGIPAYKPKQ